MDNEGKSFEEIDLDEDQIKFLIKARKKKLRLFLKSILAPSTSSWQSYDQSIVRTVALKLILQHAVKNIEIYCRGK